MTRAAAVSIENDFSKGLITEATAMNSPENSVVQSDNCVYLKNGKVKRRYGIDYETGYSVTPYTTMGIMASAPTPSSYYNQLVVTEFEWTTVSNDGATSFVVVQIGDTLVFYKTGSSDNISAGRKSFTVDLDGFLVTVPGDNVGQYTASQPCSFSSGFGTLFVTHPLCSPFGITYNATNDTITTTTISMKTRDFERLNDSLAIDTRPPPAVTNVHKYNLYNQGWSSVAKNTTGTTDALTYWDAQRTDFPSNADIWWVFKNASNQLDSGNFDSFSLGNTPAPNGHYIYSAFDSGRNAALGITGLPEYTAGNARPSQTAFFAGRVWYAGVQASGFTSKLYFTKIIETSADFGTCYQVADPTSEEDFDLQSSDGGVINIPDIDRVIRMVVVNASLLVFATNGIWTIGAGPTSTGSGFAANDYAVSKVSTSSISSPTSVVIADGTPFWWDKAGIYTFSQQGAVNVTELTIQTLINNIPGNNIQYVKGVYNNIAKTINWLYNDQPTATISDNYSYNKLLVFNTTTQSFSPLTIETGVPKVCGILFTQNAHFDPLVTNQNASIVKFLTIGAIGTSGAQGFTVSQFNSGSYMDWKTYDGVGLDAKSNFITAYRIRGQLLKKFQSNYVVVILENEDDASAFLQGIWDYSNDPHYGKFSSTAQQVYPFSETVDYTRVKRKVRGNGYSLQFRFSSETGKPFTIVGWVVSESGNNVP